MAAKSSRHHLKTEDFDYLLPDSHIARFPLAQRDQSRLLIYRDGQITHDQFINICRLIPADSMVVFNNTKVVPARLHFQRKSGAWIEILAVHELTDFQEDMAQNERVVECMIGNKKKWANEEVLICANEQSGLRMEASWQNREKNQVKFKWFPDGLSYLEALAELGEMPIPPYLNRPSEPSDKVQYQTVYARNHGAIAAPTAGLHFTDSVLQDLKNRDIAMSELTLHVGLGTFKPMKSESVVDHEMHGEEVIIPISVLKELRNHPGKFIAVGTTSVRSLESLFWIGIGLAKTGKISRHLETEQPYQWEDTHAPFSEVLSNLIGELENKEQNELRFTTQLFVMPGYRFRVVNGLITNFHQPKSTLMVLVSAFIGENWKSVYNEAIRENYRYLSYGDSSLLLP
ncbi:MAG TPA: S-adenosylmethionine:tRNA ribosyltransferase-isomerase [Catalimonadaceae bacterium]|nr:S-adenosylmethionine:tRNA ribosyltransferase-isomerase [Catalimonadaceae bacterium]